MRAANRSSSNFYSEPVLWQQHGPLRVDEPDPSGVVLSPPSDVALLPPISGPPLLALLSRRLLLLFLLDVLLVLVPPIGGGDDQPLGDDKPIPPHIAHHSNQRHWKRY